MLHTEIEHARTLASRGREHIENQYPIGLMIPGTPQINQALQDAIGAFQEAADALDRALVLLS